MEIFDWTFYGNTLRSWVIAGLVALLATAALGLLISIVRRQVARIAGRTSTRFDDVVLFALESTRLWFVFMLGIAIALPFLQLPEPAVVWVRRLALMATLAQMGIWATTAVRAYVSTSTAQRVDADAASVTTMRAMGYLAIFGIWVLLFLVGLENFGIDVTALIAGLGIGGIALALAVQNILGDLFASLSIVLDKPFVYGDSIAVGEFSGTVERVGLKTTRVRSISGEQLVFSNSDLLASRIRNYKRMSERRVSLNLAVTYQTPRGTLARIPALVREIIEAQPNTRFDRAHLNSLGVSAINFEIVYYISTGDYGVYMDRQQAINLAILSRFDEESIEFAYPTQKVFLERAREEVGG